MNAAVLDLKVAHPDDLEPEDALDQRLVDVVLAVAALPALACAALVLWFLNPLLNPGPLFHVQQRMGRHGRPFTMYKFRSMPPDTPLREPHEPVETARIGWLGGLIRRHGIDELPQLLNVLRGDMSVIGPRPDVLRHARLFAAVVPGYASRHLVRPGITGLSQVTCGYAVGLAATARKTRVDLAYIRNRSALLDARILAATVLMVVRGRSSPVPAWLLPAGLVTEDARSSGELCPWLP